MAYLKNKLDVQRCPHCNVDLPSMDLQWQCETASYTGGNKRSWRIYRCSRCGGLVTAASIKFDNLVEEMYPSSIEVHESIPSPASTYLNQSLNSLSAPAGAVMLAASAVDAMLKSKGYKNGSLYNRIDKAVSDHLITGNMGKWAHQVRLDANEPRHADEKNPLPDEGEARKCVDFAMALAEFLFVLPSRVTRGLEEATGKGVNNKK